MKGKAVLLEVVIEVGEMSEWFRRASKVLGAGGLAIRVGLRRFVVIVIDFGIGLFGCSSSLWKMALADTGGSKMLFIIETLGLGSGRFRGVGV